MTFTKAFRQVKKSHAAICIGLQQITKGIARTFTFADEDEREDVESEALTYAIRQIRKFDFRKGGDAFTYFSSVIFNAIRKELGRRSTSRQRAVTFTDLFANSVGSGAQLGGARRYFEARPR